MPVATEFRHFPSAFFAPQQAPRHVLQLEQRVASSNLPGRPLSPSTPFAHHPSSGSATHNEVTYFALHSLFISSHAPPRKLLAVKAHWCFNIIDRQPYAYFHRSLLSTSTSTRHPSSLTSQPAFPSPKPSFRKLLHSSASCCPLRQPSVLLWPVAFPSPSKETSSSSIHAKD